VSRISSRFSECAGTGRKLLIPYITAGDPDMQTSLRLMHSMVKSGADIIELGVPFSDPMADGPVIQLACERALRAKTSLRTVLALVREFRTRDRATPVVLMGYLNPIEVMGYETFARAAGEAGVDGVITVDMPPEEGNNLIRALSARGIDRIFLVAPTSSAERIASVCKASSGFVYYVSLKGVTGSSSLDFAAIKAKLAEIREHCHLPISIGFGIKDAQTAKNLAHYADAVVVGSALVRRIEEHAGDADAVDRAVCQLLSGIRSSLDGASASG
jgi:tryptophan synthase alpha chain